MKTFFVFFVNLFNRIQRDTMVLIFQLKINKLF